MTQAQHSNTRCPVVIHPAAASNPSLVRSIQQATGQLVMIVRGRPQLLRSTALPALPAFEDFSGFDGGAA